MNKLLIVFLVLMVGLVPACAHAQEPPADSLLEEVTAAAMAGDLEAQVTLGHIYLADAPKLPAAAEQAYIWFGIAAREGVGEAIKEYNAIKATMGEDQIRNAEWSLDELDKKIYPFSVDINGEIYKRSTNINAPSLPLRVEVSHLSKKIRRVRMRFNQDVRAFSLLPLNTEVVLKVFDSDIKAKKMAQATFIAEDDAGQEQGRIAITFVPVE